MGTDTFLSVNNSTTTSSGPLFDSTSRLSFVYFVRGLVNLSVSDIESLTSWRMSAPVVGESRTVW